MVQVLRVHIIYSFFFLKQSHQAGLVWRKDCGRLTLGSPSSFEQSRLSLLFLLSFFRMKLCVHYQWQCCCIASAVTEVLFVCLFFFGEELRWTCLGRWWWMYVCFLWSVFDRQVLVIGCTLGGALYWSISGSGGVDEHRSRHGWGKEGGEEVFFFFQVLVKSKFSLLYFEEIMFVYVYSALKTWYVTWVIKIRFV